MIKVSQGCLGEEEIKEVLSAFEYGYFGLAAKVDEFEQELKNYLGASFAIATNSGTNAMHLALDALGIGKGDEVISYPPSHSLPHCKLSDSDVDRVIMYS